MSSLPEFRENAARSILVAGDIDEEQVHRLTPDICRLRGESGLPITVYLNSRGGVILCAEQIRALLKTPDQEGRVCHIITIATSQADSAAANLLALGDYAIAYPDATIHCHGSRLKHSELTKERAENLAASLKQTNDDFALRLARRVFPRIAFHFPNLKSEFSSIREEAKKDEWERNMTSDLACFAYAIFGRLSPHLQNLPSEVLGNYERLEGMSQVVLGRMKAIPEGQILARTEADLLKELIDFELEQKEAGKWEFNDGGIDELTADFKSLTDYLYGNHKNLLEEQLKSFGILFLEPRQIVEYQNLREQNADSADIWLQNQAKPVVEQMWFFVVSLCRLLQSGEYGLTAKDAYWLGIVDEVIGERLPNLRLIAENPGV